MLRADKAVIHTILSLPLPAAAAASPPPPDPAPRRPALSPTARSCPPSARAPFSRRRERVRLHRNSSAASTRLQGSRAAPPPAAPTLPCGEVERLNSASTSVRECWWGGAGGAGGGGRSGAALRLPFLGRACLLDVATLPPRESERGRDKLSGTSVRCCPKPAATLP